MADQGTSREGLVGRQDELAFLHQSFGESQQGRLRVVLLAGEAGIGKSRLLDEFASRVPSQTKTLTAACFEGDGAPPLWPWIQVVRAACAAATGTLSTLPSTVTSVLGKMVPEAATELHSPPPSGHLDPAAERFRLFEAVGSLIDRVAHNSTVLILLDDLHWADVDSLLLLQFLAKQRIAAPLMILGTYRDFEMERCEQARRIIGGIERASAVSRVLLRGLEPEDCERLTRQLCASSVSEARLRSIWESSEGNPLFVHEISRATMEGAGTRESIVVPSSLRGVIESRYADLPAGALEVLRIASVIGREFEVALLNRVAQRATPELGQKFADVFDRAVHLRIIERLPATGRYRFTHALMREVLYEQLAGSTRIRLHGLVGTAVEEVYVADLDRHSADLAHHYYEAALGGWAPAALKYNFRAGDHAYSLAAFSEAASRYRDALQVIDLTDEPSPVDRCRLLLKRGRAEFLSDSPATAQPLLEEAAELARNLGEAQLFGEAVVSMHGVWGIAGASNPDHVRLLEEALEGLPDEPSDLRVALMGRLATELYWTPRRQRSEDLGRAVLALARRSGAPRITARALNAAHFALWGPDNVAERLSMARENVLLGEQIGDRLMAAGGLVWSVIDLVELGHMVEAGAAIDAYGRQAAQLQSPFFQWQHGVLEAMRTLVSGRLNEAEKLAFNAHRMGSQVQGANADMFLGVQLVQLRWHQGRLGELEDAVRGFVRQFPALRSWRAALAFIFAEQDKLDETRREMRSYDPDTLASIPRDANFLLTIALLSEVCAAVRADTHAKALYHMAQPYEERVVVVGNAAGCWGGMSYFLGRLALVMEDVAVAEHHLRAAVELHERMGALPHLALAQCRLAEVLVVAGKDDEAAVVARASRENAERVGMPRVLQLIDRIETREEPPASAHTDRADMDSEACVFRRDGELWSVGASKHPLRLRTSKGLEYIAHLIRHEGEEVLAIDLARATCDPGDATATVHDTSLRSGRDLGDAGEMLDGRARSEYRSRLVELRGELEEAHGFNDVGRAERAQAEIDSLTAELARAVGLSGRSRKAASHAERARINVTRAIKKAIALLDKHDQALAHHLRNSIRTGRFCVYAADPVRPVRWQL